MDVFLTRTALRQIEGLFLGKSLSSGLMMGHRRGNRFVVESIFPLPDVLSFPLDKHIRLTRIFGPDFIGYFTTVPGDKPPEQIMAPFASGMLFSRLGNQTSEMNFFQIEYNGKFCLQKLNYTSQEPS